MDAGWYTARGGKSEEALALFRRAAEFGGESGRDAEVGIVEQLYALRREREAEAAQQSLWTELDGQPGGLADLRIFDDMAELLCDVGQYRPALEWCQAGLARAAKAGDDMQVQDYRRGLLITRGFLRDELGIEHDEEDLAVRAETDASLTAFREMVRETLGDAVQRRQLGVPDDVEAFDGIVLRWVREDFTAIRSRWPESTASYGDSYDTYAARIQREARGYAEAGAARVRMVSGNLADYEAYARREGRDPAERSTRREYGEWRAITHPDQVLLWPPDRNTACWCDSGRKYKKCCGAPARN
ncbi:SEC-C domain-containing protein [Micromonospora sp. ALFpr18c]|uniref:SEC-C domain-containing protein n=1 Tax=Micromonospora sp. ALFpr18c TaxID=1458665 RepID=UPI001788AC8B|nr:SEC-C domain-containing protein [Micromonospora sp. ALFpr18c]